MYLVISAYFIWCGIPIRGYPIFWN